METVKAKLTESDLSQFTGTENVYRHWLGRVVYTDGVKFMAERAGAFWLIDEVVTNQMRPKVRAEEFQVWKLVVTGSKAKLTCEDGNGNLVYKKNITFTDFPLSEIKLYFVDNTVLLPSEY